MTLGASFYSRRGGVEQGGARATVGKNGGALGVVRAGMGFGGVGVGAVWTSEATRVVG